MSNASTYSLILFSGGNFYRLAFRVRESGKYSLNRYRGKVLFIQYICKIKFTIIFV